jgi:hypothetical protein
MEKPEVHYFGRMFALFRPKALIDPSVEGQNIDLRPDDAIAKLLEDRDCLEFVLARLIAPAGGLLGRAWNPGGGNHAAPAVQNCLELARRKLTA